MAVSTLKKGELVVRNSGIVSLFLLVIKIVAGLITGSIVLLSDSLDSASDLVGMIAAWFGLKIAQRKPTKKFPYGYYKAESLASLFVSFLILYASIELIISGVSKIFVKPAITIPLFAILTAFASLITSYVLSRYLKAKGTEINSSLLINSSKERLIDAVKSSIVLVSIIASYYGVFYVESIVTIFISLLVLRVGLFSIKDSVVALMDVSPSKEVENKIINIIKEIKGIEGYSGLKLRTSGPFIFGHVKIKVKKYINVKKAHEIADELEAKVKHAVKQIDTFLVHVEPYKSTKQKIVIPIKENKGLDSKVTSQFGRADNFIFITLKKGKIKSFYAKKNIFKGKKIRAGLSAVKYVLKENIDALVTASIGEISFHTLRDNLVDVYKTNGLSVKDVVRNYLNNKLTLLKSPTKGLK